MDIREFSLPWMLQTSIRDYINSDYVFHSTGMEFLCEDSRDIGYEIKEALQKQGLACVVMTPDAEYIGHDGKAPVWDFKDVTLEFIENVPINRASNKETYVSGLDLANYCSLILCGPKMNLFGTYCPKAIRQREEDKLLVTTFTFDCTAAINKVPSDIEPWMNWGYKDEMSNIVFHPSKTSDVKITYSSNDVPPQSLRIERIHNPGGEYEYSWAVFYGERSAGFLSHDEFPDTLTFNIDQSTSFTFNKVSEF